MRYDAGGSSMQKIRVSSHREKGMYACERIHCLCFDFLSGFMGICFLVGVMCSVMFFGWEWSDVFI